MHSSARPSLDVLKARPIRVAFGVAAVCCAAVSWAQNSGLQLVVNGKVASKSVRLIDGRPYAPIEDVARSLGMLVSKKPNGFEMTLAGGANQVEGLRGKVGDTLFDGKWRFKVVDLQVVDEYKIRREGGLDPGQFGNKIETDGTTFKTKPGWKFVVANCYVKNGQKSTQAFGSYYGEHTALADHSGSSYRPIGWDQEGGMFVTKALLPGAGQDLAAIFVVPEGVKLKDLVVSLMNVSDAKPNDVRVTLSDTGVSP